MSQDAEISETEFVAVGEARRAYTLRSDEIGPLTDWVVGVTRGTI